jgi:hypothetical protein
MSTTIGCLLNAHAWNRKLYSGTGSISGYRKCSNCSREETRIYDFRRQKAIWLKGKYVREEIGYPTQIFVFAGSRSSFTHVVTELSDEFPKGDVVFFWVTENFDWKEIEACSNPEIHLAPDYKEEPLTDDYRFRRLVMTGQI